MIRILGAVWFVVRFIIIGRKHRKWTWYRTYYVQPVDANGVPKRNCPKCGQNEPALKPQSVGRDIEVRYNKRRNVLKAGCHRCKAKWFERPEDWKNRSY